MENMLNSEITLFHDKQRIEGEGPMLSVVVPVHNEADNIPSLVAETCGALDGEIDYELIFVDDGSTDDSFKKLKGLSKDFPRLRILRHKHRCGQSAAIWTGIRAARAEWIATLDGDGQNDPADILRLIRSQGGLQNLDPHLMVCGYRRRRQDSWIKRVSSRIANGVRRTLLKDDTPDTGCGLKVFARSTFLSLPFFDHMHRFLPALVLRGGGRVASVEVHHRPRLNGKSHYGIGNRLWVGIIDLLGVMWLRRRMKHPTVMEEKIEA